jgi:peptidyl-prolyl cis-trans isomerase D
MLQLMRKHAKSWLIRIILGLIAIVFVFWGVGSYNNDREDRAVEINGQVITMAQYREELGRLNDQARRQFGNQFDKLAPLLNLKQRALNRLVDQTLLAQAAAEMGITVSDSEVVRSITSIEAFHRNGRFDQNLYRRLLNRNRLSPEDFEAGQRAQIQLEKLSSLLAGSVNVTPLEVEQAIIDELSQVKGVYLYFNPEDYRDQVKADEAAVKAYYEAHPKYYQEPAKHILSYLTFPASDYLDKVNITESDLMDAYELDRSRYVQPEQVHASHILFKLAEDAAPELVAAAEKKAKEVLTLAQKGDKSFADLAKEYSEGPTAESGGDLGFFQRGQMVPAFEKAAFDQIKPGEVGLARTNFGFHVIKVEEKKEAHTTPLEEVRGEIRKRLSQQAAREMAMATAERVFDQIGAGESLTEAAAAQKKTLQTTPMIIVGSSVEGLPKATDLNESLAGLGPGQTAPPVYYENGAALVMIKEHKDAFTKPLEEVKGEVEQAVLSEKASQAARQAAADLLVKVAKEAEPARALAAEKQAKTSDWLKRDEGIKDLGSSQALVKALFLLPLQHPVLSDPVEVSDGFAAAVLLERKAPTPETVQEKTKEFRAKLLADMRAALMQKYLEDLRQAAEIKVLARLD